MVNFNFISSFVWQQKSKKPVFWPKIVHDFLSKTLMLSQQSAFTASLKDIPWYLFSIFFSRHYRWTFFSHRSRVSQLDSLCSKGTLGNPLIPWAKNASYSQFRDFLGYPVLPANNCIHCFVYKSKPRQNVLGRFWKLALKNTYNAMNSPKSSPWIHQKNRDH